MLTNCDECGGKGFTVCRETDAEIYCSECCGMGSLEARGLLLALQAVRVADALARRTMPSHSLGTALRAKIEKAWASLPYSTQRWAEIGELRERKAAGAR